ncbi:restriction endonuclease subunit S [Aeromonas sanarellii]|uniref:restriction endonuclease subunit S n=1 Tax=Aeromonas sanarellii TaxID=633415 RepID=UPI0038CF8E74
MSDVVATAQQGLAGKYKQYPEYKDSGVEWLGEVPIDWGASRHKYIATFAKGKNPKELFDEVGIGRHQYLAMGFLRGLEVPKYCDLDSSTILVMENQILIIWDGSNAGEFVKATHGVLSSTMAAVTTNSNIHDGFYWYYCKSIEPEMRRHANGMGIPHVDGDELKAIVIPQPALEEQRSIAAFLDYETARIDRLIAQQQRLIELLKEKRQAVISHAVTKGLNPNAPMKDSGVEWIGQVPEHWEALPIKYVSWFVGTGGTPKDRDSFTDENEINWFTPGDFNGELVLDDSGKYVTKGSILSGDAKIYPAESVLIVGIGATLGKVGVCNFKFSCNQQINIVTPNRKIAVDFLAFSLLAQTEQMKQTSNASTIGIMNQEKTKGIQIAVPPVQEQTSLIIHLKKKLSDFSLTTSKAEQLIALLQERRSALISAAVTGKIDLRGWTPPAEEVAA